MMKRRNLKRGFTMAELLVVVAIIGVLSAVAFIAVNQHQRSLERLERDAVAREIFVAAQNHLTMAYGQGYLGLGIEEAGQADTEPGVYYFATYKGDKFSSGGSETLLDLMLPFSAVDETVRGGGSYIIRYHFDTATVMDVFYCSTDARYGYDLSSTTSQNLAEMIKKYGEGKESDRQNFNRKVIGWYGAEADSLTRIELNDPEIVVENSDKLRVGIIDNNKGIGSLQIIITGKLSEAKKVFILKSPASETTTDAVRMDANKTVAETDCDYAIVLDDITTANLHFADLVADTGSFTPGEDIILQAVAYDNTQLANIGYSAEITVNSLYQELKEGVADDKGNVSMTASISSIRHLENLDKRISNVTDTWGSNTYKLDHADQTSDLNWNAFKEKTNAGTTGIVLFGENAGSTGAGNYLPVIRDSNIVFSYDGKHHSVSDIKADYSGNAGLFESVTGISSKQATIANLALIDFDIKNSSGTDTVNAGALAGSLMYVDVTNVIAYNSTADITTGIVANMGNAGGLIGVASNCNITKSAASLYVTSKTGNAGGLIGNTTDGKVSGCYSGGHTHDGTYYRTANDGTKTADYNVTATAGNAGGLIGVATTTPIEFSYSTCSVTGQTAGGFVASITSDSISYCYATGLVSGTGTESISTVLNGISTNKTVTKDGAFAYSLTGTVTDCYYFEIINEREDDETGYRYLTALGKEKINDNINPLDADNVDDPTLNSYNNLYANPVNWTDASAYDPKLIEYYNGKYNLPTVAKLDEENSLNVNEASKTTDGVTTPADFVATHYGDWPAPEIFVVNTKSSN